MGAIEKWINKFCRDHPRFGIPNLMNVIVTGTAIVFLLDMFSGYTASALIQFDSVSIFHGEIWRLLTFVFEPMSYNLFNLALSLYFYWWIGTSLEQAWGTAHFNCFYLLGVVLNILFGLVAGSASVTFLNLSMFFAFAVLYPDTQILLFFIIPIKVKWLAWIDAAIFGGSVLLNLLHLNFFGALLPIVAIFNFFIFFWSDFKKALGYRKRHYQHRHSQQTINFKKATGKAYQEKGYIHKCAVCGKTDTDFPDMVFRYCSKCNGYYCYCEEHINNHEHIQ